MNDTDLAFSPDQISEIEQHKYFLSEKAGYDVGWDFAEQDWRSNFEQPEQPEQLEQLEQPEQPEQPVSASIRQDSAQDPAPKGIGRFLKRLLSRAASV